MTDPNKAADICNELNVMGFEHVGSSFVSFVGTEACVAIELHLESLFDDQTDDVEEDFTADMCRKRIVKIAKELLRCYDRPIPD